MYSTLGNSPIIKLGSEFDTDPVHYSYLPFDVPRDEDVVQVDVELGAPPLEATLSRHVVRDEEESTPSAVRIVRGLQHERGLLHLR